MGESATDTSPAFRLDGSVAVITGASQGIGLETALTLANAGADVALVARSLDKLEMAGKRVRAFGGRVLLVATDVVRADEVKSTFARVFAEMGRLDILVNNAGIARDGLAIRMKVEDWDRVVQTNLTGTFLCTQAVLPPMLRARYGRIINMSSVLGQIGGGGTVNYSASKAGIIGFTKALAREVASRNITVNAIAPGLIETAMTGTMSAQAREQAMAGIPLGRIGTAKEVAMGVLFLASREAAYITGQVLNINGGMYM